MCRTPWHFSHEGTKARRHEGKPQITPLSHFATVAQRQLPEDRSGDRRETSEDHTAPRRSGQALPLEFIPCHTCPKTGLIHSESRESAQNARMEKSSTAIGETLSPRLRLNCHPEEACVRIRRNMSVTRKSRQPCSAGRRRIYCSMGSSQFDLHVAILERQHVRLQRGTEAAKEASTLL